MGTYTITKMTIAEVMKRLDPDGNMAEIAEVLAEENTIFQDAPWQPSNAIWANKTTRRASEPAGTWRKFNQGVAIERSETVEVMDTIGLLEGRSEIDVDIINSYPDKDKARSDEDKSFAAGLGKEMTATLLYGDGVDDPEEFSGLAPRLDALNSSLYNVIGAGGSGGDTTSIFVVNWGRDVYMGYPPGTQVGLQMINMGVESVADAGGSNKFLAFVSVFKWRAGLIVRDHKCIGRIANIEKAGASNIFNEDDLIDLLPRMRTGPGTRIYVNKTIISQMWKRLKDKTNVYFTRGEGLDAGGPVMYFNGHPIRQCDQITEAETVVA